MSIQLLRQQFQFKKLNANLFTKVACPVKNLLTNVRIVRMKHSRFEFTNTRHQNNVSELKVHATSPLLIQNILYRSFVICTLINYNKFNSEMANGSSKVKNIKETFKWKCKQIDMNKPQLK